MKHGPRDRKIILLSVLHPWLNPDSRSWAACHRRPKHPRHSRGSLVDVRPGNRRAGTAVALTRPGPADSMQLESIGGGTSFELRKAAWDDRGERGPAERGPRDRRACPLERGPGHGTGLGRG